RAERSCTEDRQPSKPPCYFGARCTARDVAFRLNLGAVGCQTGLAGLEDSVVAGYSETSGQALWMTLNRKAVLRPNRIHPFNDSSPPMSCQRDGRPILSCP